MALKGYPFDGQAVTEAEFSTLFKNFQQTGVVPTEGGGMSVSADGGGMRVFVDSGFAVVRGFGVSNSDTTTLDIEPSSSQNRWDAVYLRLDPSKNEVTFEVKKGIPGSNTYIAGTQTRTGVYEMLLALVQVFANVGSIRAENVYDRAPRIGTNVGCFTRFTRPADPTVGYLGYNETDKKWEFFNGSKWIPLATESESGGPANVKWSSISGKPSTFPPSSHRHPWSAIDDVPLNVTKPPWGWIREKPTTFPPSPHTHCGDDITSQVPKATLAWGSRGPRESAAQGPGPWYTVWVNGNGKFMRNTSSLRYKQNVRDANLDTEAVLGLTARIYDRKDSVDEDTGEMLEGRKDEFGLIAEEVYEKVPEIVVHNEDGEIETVRYDLVGVALLPVAQDHERRLTELEHENKMLRLAVDNLMSEVNLMKEAMHESPGQD